QPGEPAADDGHVRLDRGCQRGTLLVRSGCFQPEALVRIIRSRGHGSSFSAVRRVSSAGYGFHATAKASRSTHQLNGGRLKATWRSRASIAPSSRFCGGESSQTLLANPALLSVLRMLTMFCSLTCTCSLTATPNWRGLAG